MKEIKSAIILKATPPWAVLMPSESSYKELHAIFELKLNLSYS
jgi:hypothetical protein